MSELLPCPFCGSTDINTEGPCHDAFMCNGCGVSQYDQPGHSEAIAAWNTRSLRNAQSEAVAWGKPAHPSAAEPFFIFDTDRVHDWQKAVFTIPLYTHPAPPLAVTDEMVEFITEAGGLQVATIEHDQYSLIEIVKSRSARNAVCLTIHRVSDETGRRDDMSIDLTPGEAAKVAAALTAALEAKQ